VPVSAHPIEAVNLKDPRLGLYDQLDRFIDQHDVTKGRVRLELAPGENFASLTVNEYETLLMRHDLAEVLRNPIRFAAEKARHAWDDPLSVPGKAMGYATYDLVHALNQLVEALGLSKSRIEGMLARALEVPASRFLRMKRSVDLLVSDARTPGKGAVVEGTFQAPIMVQWRPAPGGVRQIQVALIRFE
jgi:SHS2 domain-containing protein